MRNKDLAKQVFETIKGLKDPVLVAYLDGDVLKLLALNDAAIALWQMPGELYQGYQDVSIVALFEPQSIPLLFVYHEGSVDLSINAKGSKRVSAQIHCFNWGLWIQFDAKPKGISLEGAVALPGSIEKVVKAWNTLGEELRKSVTVFASLGVAAMSLLISVAPWIESAIPKKVEATSPQGRGLICKILAQEFPQYPGPLAMGIAYWEYTNGGRKRVLGCLYSNLFSQDAFNDFRSKSTSETGWREQLAAHKNKKPGQMPRAYNIKLDKIADPNSGIATIMREAGTSELISFPVYQNENLKGYLSIGYREEITPKDFEDVTGRMLWTAKLIAENLD